MKIEDVSALRKWVVKRIDDFCPTAEATSNYVITLIKKESSGQEELMEICRQSLVTFLKDKTDDFVSDLFHTLSSGSYMEEDEDAVDYDDFEEENGTDVYVGSQRERSNGDGDRNARENYSRNKEEDDDDERDWRRERHRGDENEGGSSSGLKRRASDNDDNDGGMSRKQPRPDNKQKPCFAFQRGECHRGDRCHFSHQVQYHGTGGSNYRDRGGGGDRYNNGHGGQGAGGWGGSAGGAYRRSYEQHYDESHDESHDGHGSDDDDADGRYGYDGSDDDDANGDDGRYDG